MIGGRLRAQDAIDALALDAPIDQSAWSVERVRAYAASPTVDAPLAVLRIPRLKLAVPIHEGVDAPVLDQGAGHIPETARPGDESGNVGIAGHRDSFFRGLKDVRTGDEIELATRDARDRYVVERTWVVGPDDVSVLEPTAAPSMTLVTCYPFYYVGSAPRRYIVRAVRAGREVR